MVASASDHSGKAKKALCPLGGIPGKRMVNPSFPLAVGSIDLTRVQAAPLQDKC